MLVACDSKCSNDIHTKTHSTFSMEGWIRKTQLKAQHNSFDMHFAPKYQLRGNIDKTRPFSTRMREANASDDHFTDKTKLDEIKIR
jgi:hypothetical protein